MWVGRERGGWLLDIVCVLGLSGKAQMCVASVSRVPQTLRVQGAVPTAG